MFYVIFRLCVFIIMVLDFLIITAVTFFATWLPICINKWFMARLFQIWCSAFIRFMGVQCHIHHKFKPPLPKRYILISNHPSGLDILTLNAIFPVHPLAKEEIKQWWILGRIAKAIGSVFVKREDRQSRRTAKQDLIDSVDQGYNLLIYPEGGCFGKHLRPFKYGTFEIAIATKIPVLPVYLQYEAENDFEWGDYGLIRHIYYLFLVSNKHFHCYIFDPVSPETFDNSQAMTDYVHQLYARWEARYRLP